MSVIGPGEGFLFGTKAASVADAARAHGDDLAKMRAELRAKLNGGLYSTAIAAAASDVTSEILAEKASNGKVRRLSDPANSEARNDSFVKHVGEHVNRLSGGQLNLTGAEATQLKARRLVK